SCPAVTSHMMSHLSSRPTKASYTICLSLWNPGRKSLQPQTQLQIMRSLMKSDQHDMGLHVEKRCTSLTRQATVMKYSVAVISGIRTVQLYPRLQMNYLVRFSLLSENSVKLSST